MSTQDLGCMMYQIQGPRIHFRDSDLWLWASDRRSHHALSPGSAGPWGVVGS